MSRYTKTHPKEAHLRIAYGYDFPQQAYFYGIFDSTKEDENGDEKIVSDLEKYFVGCSRNELFEKLQEFEAPEKHTSMVALDLPIE